MLVEAIHTAPGEPGPVEEQLLDVPADPILNAQVATATAHARWNNAGCVAPGTPIATARTDLADANVITNTPLGTSLVALDNEQGDTVFSQSTTELINVPGQTGKGVKSTATTQVTGIRLFKGTENEILVNVLAPPIVTATATGKPGGAKVEYSEPILQIFLPGQAEPIELNASSVDLEVDALPLVKLRVGQLTSMVAANGTSAEGNAALLELIILESEGAIEPLLSLSIAGGTVSAKSPSGGVSCPGGDGGTTGGGGGGGECGTGNPLRELQIGPSTLTAVAGSTFTYTISVSNRGDCTLEDVHVVDRVNGPPGSTITSTTPKADRIDGLEVEWNDIGPLEPGQIKVLVVTVQVPEGAADGSSYSSKVDVTAKGGGEDFSQSAEVQGPKVGAAVGGACNLAGSKVGPSHEEVEPGETFNVYVSLINSGSEPCPNVKVTLPIDDDLQFVGCTNSCTVDGRTITWTIAEIGPGDSLTLVATLRTPENAADGTEFEHTVTIADGKSIQRTATGPRVTGTSVLAAFPSGDLLGVAGGGLPRTGAYIALMTLIGLGLLIAGETMRRRARAAGG